MLDIILISANYGLLTGRWLEVFSSPARWVLRPRGQRELSLLEAGKVVRTDKVFVKRGEGPA